MILKHLKPSLIVGCVCAVLVPLIFWLAGFNFDERGPAAFFCFVFTLGAFVGATWVSMKYLEIEIG